MLAVAGRNTATVYHELALFALVARKDLYFIQVGNNSIESLLCNNRGWESQSFRRQDPRCRWLDLPLLMGLTQASDEVLEAWFAAHELTRASADGELSLLLFQMETVILSPRGHSVSLTNPTNTGGGILKGTSSTKACGQLGTSWGLPSAGIVCRHSFPTPRDFALEDLFADNLGEVWKLLRRPPNIKRRHRCNVGGIDCHRVSQP